MSPHSTSGERQRPAVFAQGPAAEDKGGRSRVQLAVGFGQANAIFGKGVSFKYADFKEELPGFGGSVILLPHGRRRLTVITNKLLDRLRHP